MGAKQRYCRKCLLMDMPEEEAFQKLQEHIRGIPPELRVEDPVYRKRLQECRNCEELKDGTCLLCGCYVEMRALIRYKGCPAYQPRWTKE